MEWRWPWRTRPQRIERRQIDELIESMFPLKSGRPSVAATAGNFGFSSIIQRDNVRNYKVRPGKNVLDTLKIVRDRDPDASKAVVNFLLLMGQGYNVTIHRGVDANGKPNEDKPGQLFIEDFDKRVGEEYGGGMDNLIDVLNLCLVTHGAMAVELELDDSLREVIDVHPIDPARVEMKREEKTNRLMRGLMVGQNVDGADKDGFLELSPRQFRYVPFHPDVDSPYGRSPLLSALASVFFKIELLEDLKAVVHNQGYPRLSVGVVQQAVWDNMPAIYKEPGNTESAVAFMTAFLDQLKTDYSTLQPDDTFIHWDNITVDTIGGAGTGSFDFTGLSDVLDAQIVAGLKQLPVLLGRNEGSTTTHATVQWRIFALQIEAMQRRTKRLLEWVHESALNISGRQADSTVEFESQPTTDRLVEAQAFNQEIDAWIKLVAQGWADAEEAAQALLGHPPVKEVTTEPEATEEEEETPDEAEPPPVESNGTSEEEVPEEAVTV